MTEREAIDKFLFAWDSLPEGWYRAKRAADWINSDLMKNGIAALREARSEREKLKQD